MVEIDDEVARACIAMLEKRYAGDVDLGSHLSELLHSELCQACAPGFDTDGLTGCKTHRRFRADLSAALFGSGWRDNSTYLNRYQCIDLLNFKQ